MTLESIAPLPHHAPPWQPERPGPTRREPRRARHTTRRDTIQNRPIIVGEVIELLNTTLESDAVGVVL